MAVKGRWDVPEEEGRRTRLSRFDRLVCVLDGSNDSVPKQEEYDAMTEQATRERRKLDTEVSETPEEAQSRLVKAAQNDQLKDDVLASHAAFLCRDCQKQYKTVKEMENHLSSYDHHHRKRLQELLKKPSVSASEQDAKRKREKQQEAAMLQKRIELAAAVSATAAPVAAVPVSTASTASTKPSASAAKVGFSFGGGNKSAGLTKKPLKKTATAFSPFGSGS